MLAVGRRVAIALVLLIHAHLTAVEGKSAFIMGRLVCGNVTYTHNPASIELYEEDAGWLGFDVDDNIGHASVDQETGLFQVYGTEREVFGADRFFLRISEHHCAPDSSLTDEGRCSRIIYVPDALTKEGMQAVPLENIGDIQLGGRNSSLCM